jgi:hypothetical protein
MIVHPDFGGGSDALAPGDQAAGAIDGATAFARDQAQASVQAEKMHHGLARGARMGANQQGAEPRAMPVAAGSSAKLPKAAHLHATPTDPREPGRPMRWTGSSKRHFDFCSAFIGN